MLRAFGADFSLSGLGQIVIYSLLAAQFVVWLIEIRTVGFRTWMRESMRQSYFGYLRRYGRREWGLFAKIFCAVLVLFSLNWSFRT